MGNIFCVCDFFLGSFIFVEKITKDLKGSFICTCTCNCTRPRNGLVLVYSQRCCFSYKSYKCMMSSTSTGTCTRTILVMGWYLFIADAAASDLLKEL